MTDAPDAVGEPEAHERPLTVRWILIALLVVALVLLLAWARRDPPFDDRVPDSPDALPTMAVRHFDRGGV